MGITIEEKKALRKLKEMVSRKYKLLEFILYGSKVTGNDTEESDIDLMIELEEETIDVRWNIYKMVAQVNIDFGCVISPILFSRGELEKGPMKESPIYRRVQEKGISI